ncbi:MAG: hypothetical protein FD180_3386 [Planctomycetota bacterium]|nr:MAG: hypothetical protein FD180_3386 [Planctomycetota bacterium]
MNPKRRPTKPRKKRLPWMIADLLTPLPGEHIEFDDRGLKSLSGDHLRWSLGWQEIRRIGWMTEDTGIAVTDDRFLVLQAPDTVYFLADGAQGVAELDREIERRFKLSYGPLGSLANRTDNASVVTWPAEDSGRELWALLERDFGNNVPVHYMTSRT